MDWSQNNDLGGRDYPEDEQQMIMQLAMQMKLRDQKHTTSTDLTDPRGIRPKHYMYLYVKAAAAIWEVAKALYLGNSQNDKLTQKSLESWVYVISGLKVQNVTTYRDVEKKLLEGGDDDTHGVGSLPDRG